MYKKNLKTIFNSYAMRSRNIHSYHASAIVTWDARHCMCCEGTFLCDYLLTRLHCVVIREYETIFNTDHSIIYCKQLLPCVATVNVSPYIHTYIHKLPSGGEVKVYWDKHIPLFDACTNTHTPLEAPRLSTCTQLGYAVRITKVWNDSF